MEQIIAEHLRDIKTFRNVYFLDVNYPFIEKENQIDLFDKVYQRNQGLLYKDEEGITLSGKREGLWISWHTKMEDGRTVRDGEQKETEGIYRNGLEEGPWTHWYSLEDGGQKQQEGNYRNGIGNGLFTSWYPLNGGKEEEGNYRFGVREGLWTYWHPVYYGGGKWQEGNYQNGLKEGLWTIWDSKGLRQINYKEGQPMEGPNIRGKYRNTFNKR